MIPVQVLAVQYLANAAPGLCAGLGIPPGFPSLAMLTTDCDDATYIALDAATKAAEVEAAYARSFYAGTVSSVGSFLAAEAGVPLGSAVAYLIAPPLEAMFALDEALKAADVILAKLYAPPSETNFGGALLSGTQSACEAACEAFRQRVRQVARHPRN